MKVINENTVLMEWDDELFASDYFDLMLDRGQDIPTALKNTQSRYWWITQKEFWAWLTK